MPRYFTVTVPQGLSTIKLDSKGCASCQITVKNVSRTAIDGRGVLTSLPIARPPAGAVEKGWVKIEGPTDCHFEVDQEEVFLVKIDVPQPKRGEAPQAAGNYGFRLDVINIARPDDSADQSQALGFTVAAATPPPPSKLPLILLVAALALIVGGVATWLMLRKKTVADIKETPSGGIWSPSTTPSTPDSNDGGAVELGLKFQSAVPGTALGVRFYKAPLNTGVHVGNLWSSNGTLLATAIFTSETASGWQQVNFATPVSIAANTTYVVSYFAPNGRYAYDANFFANAGVTNGALHALANSEDPGGNGVFKYGSSINFPSQTYRAPNYWVDIVFTH